MSALTPWDPFRELDELQSRLATLLGRAPLRQRGASGDEVMTQPDWAPLADIVEDDKGYLIRLELPEVDKDDVSITVENRVLTVSGERKLEREEEGKTYHRIERAYGRFMRSFVLPQDADPDEVSATYKEGMLEIHVGKADYAKPKRIEIKASGKNSGKRSGKDSGKEKASKESTS